jgi:hypothetical protein
MGTTTNQKSMGDVRRFLGEGTADSVRGAPVGGSWIGPMQRNRLAGDLPASARVGRVSRGTTREPRGPSFLPPPAAPRGQTNRRLLHLHHFAKPDIV